MSLNHTSGVTAQWHKLVSDAQIASGISLEKPIKSYLIYTLIQYTQRPDIAARIFAIDYLLANQEQGHVRTNQLRDLADQCLLYAGLFPQYSKRRNVRVSYYVDIGRSAYSDISNCYHDEKDIYAELSDKFVALMDTLLAIHHIDKQESHAFILEPETALQTWQDTQSQQALKILQQQIKSDNIVDFTQHRTNKH